MTEWLNVAQFGRSCLAVFSFFIAGTHRRVAASRCKKYSRPACGNPRLIRWAWVLFGHRLGDAAARAGNAALLICWIWCCNGLGRNGQCQLLARYRGDVDAERAEGAA